MTHDPGCNDRSTIGKTSRGMERLLGIASLAWLAMAALAVAAPVAPTAASAPPPKHFALTDTLRLDSRIRTGVLPNGMRYFVRANHKPEHRVSLRLAVNIGSTAETDDQRGLAHFLEHMNFNGSEHFAPDELDSYLRAIGMRIGPDANAYTSFDETVYMLEVPTDRDTLLEHGVVALSDFAGRATLTRTEFEKERGVVLEEWRLARGAEERIWRKQVPSIYYGSRYADRDPIGLPEIIQKAPRERMQAFYRDWYTPERMAVVAVGDIDPTKMERLLRAHFGDLPRAKAPRPTPTFEIPAHPQTLVSVVTDPEATRTGVEVMFKRPHRESVTVGDYRKDLLVSLYGSMLNARFGEITHRADPPFLFASAYRTDVGRGTDAWDLSAGVKDGGIEAGLRALLEEAERVRRHGFLPGELARAKDRSRASWEKLYAERDKSESGGFAREYVSYFLTGEPAPGIETEYAVTMDLLDGVTLDEVNALGDDLMRDAGRVVLASAPSTSTHAAPSEAALKAVLDGAKSMNPAAWVDSTAGKSLMTRLPDPGRITSRRTVDAIGVTVLTLSNGVEVWLKPTTFRADEIVFSAYALGGTSLADSTELPMLWMLPGVIGDAGVGGFTSTELRKILSGHIASANATYSRYTHGVSGGARPADLETALQLTYLVFTQPTRDPEGFAAYQDRVHAFITDRRNSPEAVYSDTAAAVNSGGFYMDRVPTLAEFDAVSLDRILAFHRERFANAADFRFAFAGNFQVDSIAPLLARYLGSLPSTGKRTSTFAAKGPLYPNGVITKQVRKGLEPKSSTRITFFTNGSPIDELDMHRARACATILSDHLRQTLRESLGGTYGVSAGFGTLGPLPGYNTMTVSFGCDPARVDTLVNAALEEVRKLRDAGPSLADVQKDQEIERRELEIALQQNATWTGSILTSLQFGIDPARIAKRRERIDLLTAENLRDTFRKYFPMDRRTVITLRPEASGEAGASTAPNSP